MNESNWKIGCYYYNIHAWEGKIRWEKKCMKCKTKDKGEFLKNPLSFDITKQKLAEIKICDCGKNHHIIKWATHERN